MSKNQYDNVPENALIWGEDRLWVENGKLMGVLMADDGLSEPVEIYPQPKGDWFGLLYELRELTLLMEDDEELENADDDELNYYFDYWRVIWEAKKKIMLLNVRKGNK